MTETAVFKSQQSLCSWVTFFVNSANKNTSKNNFNSQLRRDDFLVILYTTRHEFLYRCVMSSHSEDTFYYFPTQPVCHHQGLLQRTTSWIYDDPESELHSTTSAHSETHTQTRCGSSGRTQNQFLALTDSDSQTADDNYATVPVFYS